MNRISSIGLSAMVDQERIARLIDELAAIQRWDEMYRAD
jgi:hypothetical protein